MEDSAHPGGVLGPYAAALKAALLQPFLRLNFVTLWVRDQKRSRRFFVDKLNFEAIVDVQIPDAGRWVVVAPPAAGWLPGAAAGAGWRIYNGVGVVKHNLTTRLRLRAGAGSRAVRRFCFWPDRSSQTLEAAPARPTMGVDKALGAFSRALS